MGGASKPEAGKGGGKDAKPKGPRYNTDLRAEIQTEVNDAPKARVHSVEWRKVMEGDPVEINPSLGHGFKVRRWGVGGSCGFVRAMRAPCSPMRRPINAADAMPLFAVMRRALLVTWARGHAAASRYNASPSPSPPACDSSQR